MILMKAALLPYLNFDGETAEAMRFYHSIFGGELAMQTFAEANMASGPHEADRILHAQLKSDSFSIMASDTHPDFGPLLNKGSNVNLILVGDAADQARLTEIFHGLTEGGTIEMALGPQFWGDIHGALVDRFGVPWMINISPASEG
jgi:PhnB protein